MPIKSEIDKLAKNEFGLDDNLNEITILDKYKVLKSIVADNFDERVWFLLDACLSVIATLMIEDLVNPIGLNLVDGPSSEKTTVLSMLYDLPMAYRSDSFTPASFVSHAANRNKKQLQEADLLPRIRHKCIIIPELAPIFGARREDLIKNFSVLTRVFDGEGLLTDSGSHGQRGYKGDYHFAWLGATTPIAQSIWNVMGQLGSRLLFLTADSRLTPGQRMERAYSSLRSIIPYKKRVKNCRIAVNEFMSFLTANQTNDNFFRSITWDIAADNQNIMRKIGCLAELTARARSKVSYWKNSGSFGDSDEGYTQPVIEGPERLMSVLYGLARGHAILNGRDQINHNDLPLIIAVSLSSMPDDRRQVIDLLIDGDHPEKSSVRGDVNSTEIVDILSYSRPTAIKIIKKLSILKLGKCNEVGGSDAKRFTLSGIYSWLLTDEFAELRRIWDTKGGQSNDPEIPF